MSGAGALRGLRVLEIASIGPGPFCGMMLADHGASVLRIDRPGGSSAGIPLGQFDVLLRGRPTLELDLKQPAAIAAMLDLVGAADVLIEGFRPGVMERLGLGPDICRARNPRLVYGRMTGWGQTGPLAAAPGHDINYLALTGALHAIGPAGGAPTPPLNMVADFGGGGMMLAFGVLAAVLSARASGQGQVVDAAMVEGASLLNAFTHGLLAAGLWPGGRGENLLDGGAPFYGAYETSDGEHVAVGPIEAPFWRAFRAALGLDDDPLFEDQTAREKWPAMKARVAAVLRSRTQAEWTAALEGTDGCLSPVLAMADAPAHPHLAARAAFIDRAGFPEPAPAPRFSDTPGAVAAERTVAEVLAEWGAPDPRRASP